MGIAELHEKERRLIMKIPDRQTNRFVDRYTDK